MMIKSKKNNVRNKKLEVRIKDKFRAIRDSIYNDFEAIRSPKFLVCSVWIPMAVFVYFVLLGILIQLLYVN